ncbi:MAG: hypothetical protein Q8R92_19855 [Deltaproteobacteria bacterium]|nr:hypothetical protein [Deltaproteobacteria bacterium]
MSDPFSSQRGTKPQYRHMLDNSEVPFSERGDLSLDQYIDRLTDEIHQRVEHQRSVVRKLLCMADDDSLCAPYCPLADCPRLENLRSVLRETIQVLEDTRRSFKCKRLEVMRKKLIDSLEGR